MKKFWIGIVLAGGLLFGCTQTISVATIFATAAAVWIRDGGEINIPSSPIEPW